MFVTNWISTTKIQKISEITNFFRHYFLSRTEVYICDVIEKTAEWQPNTPLEKYRDLLPDRWKKQQQH